MSMNERDLYQIMMLSGVALSVISALGAVVLLVATITHGVWLVIPTIFMAAITIGCAWGTVYFGQRISGHKKVFSNEVEQEVLTQAQRRELRKARGGLVMERALIEIENERDNIVHRQIEASRDPNKPPHKTRFGDD